MPVPDPPLVDIRPPPFISDVNVEITTDGTFSDGGSDVSSTWSLDSVSVYTSRGDFASWEDVGVELVTIPSGPGRSLDDSSDPDTDSDGGLEELTSFLWVHRNCLEPLLRTETMSFTNWEHLLCFTVSMVLNIPLDPGRTISWTTYLCGRHPCPCFLSRRGGSRPTTSTLCRWDSPFGLGRLPCPRCWQCSASTAHSRVI